jgi:hypothetical protein
MDAIMKTLQLSGFFVLVWWADEIALGTIAANQFIKTGFL